jgi:methyl-accepting chemotaxis protein-1 (serine sensor receptor)
MKLANKISALVSGALLAVGLIAAGGYLLLSLATEKQVDNLMATAGYGRDIGLVRSHFQTQVQEWKNVLLRGSDAGMLKKYWGGFEASEKKASELAHKLADSLPAGDAKDKVTQFATAHDRMGQGYRGGFEKFRSFGFDASVGDAAVKGIDRDPNRLVGDAIQAVAALEQQIGEQAAAHRARIVIGSVVALLCVGLLACAAVFVFVRRMMSPLADAAAVLSHVARGDLTVPVIRRNGEDEIAQVVQATEQLQWAMTDVVGRIRSNAECVATASAEIAQGNQDLSNRTEQQASALQQTAATMEELGLTVRNNADNAKQANQLAQDASDVAARGGAVVGQVVTTMQGINESSRKIGDIISVIDGIAFQTNILALNAAVEAARAGEQGRGFAVVAGEVRALAQRSAEAAKEIKSLIGRSVGQVEQGSELVDQAGKTMAEIVGSIRRVTDIVAEISAASVEQSSGVERIGDAITQMDQATQQNAALVEESAAAAESLKLQAAHLVQAVEVFRLSQQTAPGAGRIEPTGPEPMPTVTPVTPARHAAPLAVQAGPRVQAPIDAKPRPEPATQAAPSTSDKGKVPAEANGWEAF